jgi:hypothetical protein
MKTILCILALLVLSASTADAYVRRTVGYGRGYYGHPVARLILVGHSTLRLFIKRHNLCDVHERMLRNTRLRTMAYYDEIYARS